MEKLYEVVKTKDFDKISKYIRENYELLKSECDEDAYAPSTLRVYKLNEDLVINVASGFDVFGANKTGGYYIDIEDILLMRFENFPVFSHNLTIIGDKKEENIVEICNYEDLLHTVNNLEPIIYNEEYFLKHLKNNSNNLDIVWTKMDSDIKKKYATEFMNFMYYKAMDKLNKIREYDRYSPYGGEDITYFPDSYGECFIDMIKSVGGIHKKEAMLFLINKDENDIYVKKYVLAKKIVKDDIYVIELLKNYHENCQIVRKIHLNIDYWKSQKYKLSEYLIWVDSRIIKTKNTKIKTKNTKNNINELNNIRNNIEKDLFDIEINIEQNNNLLDRVEKIQNDSEIPNIAKTSEISKLFFDTMENMVKDMYICDSNGNTYIKNEYYDLFLKKIGHLVYDNF